MFTISILGLALAGAEPIIVVDEPPAPTIRIDLTRYDLRQANELYRVEMRIHEAAKDVCVRGYGVELYLERVACVKSAIADGDRQLRGIVTNTKTAAALSAASISISTK